MYVPINTSLTLFLRLSLPLLYRCVNVSVFRAISIEDIENVVHYTEIGNKMETVTILSIHFVCYIFIH